MALVDQSGLIADSWVEIDDHEPITPRTQVIVTPTRLQAEGDVIFRAGAQVGVILEPDTKVEEFVDYYGRLGLVGLRFSAMKDGRSFTLARLLRTRFGFTGDLRAIGELIPDQVPFLLRCGFTSFDVADGFDVAAMQKSLGYYSHLYQRPGAADRNIIALRVGGAA